MPSMRADDGQLADLADAVVELARQLDLRAPELHDVVPLTGTEITVIRELHRSPGVSPSQLATATGLHRSNLSTVLRALEARGLVVREHSEQDARSVSLVPTELADQNIARIRAYWAKRLRGAPEALLADGVTATEALLALVAALAR